MMAPTGGTGRARSPLTRLRAAPAVGLVSGAILAGCAGLGQRPSPIAERPITVDGRCEQTDVADFRERARLRVDNGRVETLSWQLWVGTRGSCRFELADFRAVQARPHVELLARDGSGCKLMIWRDDRHITLGHAGCESRCSPGISDDAWPVMFDPRTGGCAADR
jgi:hypothetical protein